MQGKIYGTRGSERRHVMAQDLNNESENIKFRWALDFKKSS